MGHNLEVCFPEENHRIMAMLQGKKVTSPNLSSVKATRRDISKGMRRGMRKKPIENEVRTLPRRPMPLLPCLS